ncbi:hypothetical protein [Pseudarthrobacter sp. S9]|uniref:hypothetical protein n=1 Tax=Pseudarthrobacter sp. S9 TaxID=3418421 RepID=UPI003D04C6F7
MTHRVSSLIRHPGRKVRHGRPPAGRLPEPAMAAVMRAGIRRVAAVLVGCLLITGYVAVAPYGSSGATGSHVHNSVLPAAAMAAAPAAVPDWVDGFGQR